MQDPMQTSRRMLQLKLAYPALLLCGALLAVPVLSGCKRNATQEVVAPVSTGGSMHPYTGQLEKDDFQWVRATKDYSNTRYSTLDQINTGNAANLKVAWT